MEKQKYIKELGYIYVSIWESEFDKQMMESTNMAMYIQNLEMVSPLKPRDACYGDAQKPSHYTRNHVMTNASAIMMSHHSTRISTRRGKYHLAILRSSRKSSMTLKITKD